MPGSHDSPTCQISEDSCSLSWFQVLEQWLHQPLSYVWKLIELLILRTVLLTPETEHASYLQYNLQLDHQSAVKLCLVIKEGLDLLPEQIWSSLQKVKADGKFYCKITAETKKEKSQWWNIDENKIQMEWDNVQITWWKIHLQIWFKRHFSSMVTHLIFQTMKCSIIVIALIGCDSASKTTTVLL